MITLFHTFATVSNFWNYDAGNTCGKVDKNEDKTDVVNETEGWRKKKLNSTARFLEFHNPRVEEKWNAYGNGWKGHRHKHIR